MQRGFNCSQSPSIFLKNPLWQLGREGIVDDESISSQFPRLFLKKPGGQLFIGFASQFPKLFLKYPLGQLVFDGTPGTHFP